jgi:hypothetical protein
MLHKLLLFLKGRKQEKKPYCPRCEMVLRGMGIADTKLGKRLTDDEVKIMLEYWHEQHSK